MGYKRKVFYKKINPLSIAIQALHLHQTFPESKITFHGNNRLTWRGFITPTSLSQKYHIEIRYKFKEKPDVVVIAPPFERYDDEKLPHVFSRNRLCLFRYKYFEWNSEMRIDQTIIPWASLWLFYYEIWLATGIWCGGDEHANGKNKIESG
jgi:hypothetical protein